VKIALLAVLVSLALPAAASAQLPPTGPPQPGPAPQPQPQPAPEPQPAKISVRLGSGISDKGRVYVLKGDKLLVRGRIKPFVEGQKVVVELRRKGKVFGRAESTVRKGKKDGGDFQVTLRVKRTGAFVVQARHDKTDQQQGAKSKRVGLSAIRPGARVGSRGPKVRLLQRALASQAYVTSRGGRFDDATARAVMAFRKVNGMSRNSVANRTVYKRLFAGQGGYKLRYPNAGKHVEFDWSRQVLVLARGGKPERIYHASSGTAATPTVFGTFRFYRKEPGTNGKGMVESNYFIRGYAIHGYKDVPTYPASHGCIRIPIPNAASVDAWISLGDRIFVYR
jgi:lipoprotein-anchoring transpeptidase ErfK/SrfK